MKNNQIKNIWITITEFRELLKINGLREPNYNNIFRKEHSYDYIKSYLRVCFMSKPDILKDINNLLEKADNELDLLNLISNSVVDNIKTRLILKGMWMWYDNTRAEIEFNKTLGLKWDEELDRKYGIDGVRYHIDHFEFFQFKNKGFNEYAISKWKNHCEKISKELKNNFKFLLIFNSNNNVYDVVVAGVYKNYKK